MQLLPTSRRRSLLLIASVFITSALTPILGRAQNVLASTSIALATTNDKLAGANEKTVLTGKITNPAGPLPGAVVILTATKQMAVTNADGEFEFEVPANAGPLEARVTYAGYADEKMTLSTATAESTLSLTNASVVVVARRQHLENYLRTAHKQVKRELRQVYK